MKVDIGEFTRDTLVQRHEGTGLNKRFVFTPEEVYFLSKTTPQVAQEIAEASGVSIHTTEEAYMQQAKTIIARIATTIDNSIFKGVMNPGIVAGKVKDLARLCDILGVQQDLSKIDLDGDNANEVAFRTKQRALELSDRFAQSRPQTTLDEIRPFGFEQELLDILGGDVKSLLVYGSSARNGGGKDYDVLAIVSEFEFGMYERLRDKQSDISSDKPVGIMIMPEQKLPHYLECDDKILHVPGNSRVLYGEAVSIPIISEEHAIERKLYKAGSGLRSLRGFATNTSKLDALVNKAGLREYMLKLEIFVQQGIMQYTRGELLSKQEVIELAGIPQYDYDSMNQEESYNAVFDANMRMQRAVTELVHTTNF